MEASGAPEGSGRGVTGSNELARNALGLPAILFCIVTGSAPLAAMMFNDPLSGYGIGIARPCRASGWRRSPSPSSRSRYVEMARRMTTAGGIYSYMAYGFGRVVGLGAAVAIAAAYILFAAGVNGVTSYFAQTEHPQPLRRLRHGLAHLRVLLHRADVPDHVLPRRDRGEDPRGLPHRRADHPHDLLVRRRREGRRAGRDRLGGAEPGRALQRRRRRRGSRARLRRRRSQASASSPPSGRGSASRWRRTTPRSPAIRRR